MFFRALLKQSILEIEHNLSGKLFQSLLLFTINEFSGASTPTRGILTFNLCALEVLVFVSETNVTKSDKYDGQKFYESLTNSPYHIFRALCEFLRSHGMASVLMQKEHYTH
jgi:hypothetical protein